mmetsp:Transcript_2608/g.6672  ORF Transcript_2608/g.6672 Transcript_2608/m.6672 type:complete len:514 (+) Transcript_2608:54-1595(+)
MALTWEALTASPVTRTRSPIRDEWSLSARARKQIYSFSDISNPTGASPRSIYDPSRQHAIYREERVSAKPLKELDVKLASPRDVRVTQNIGSGVVAPISSVQSSPAKVDGTTSTPPAAAKQEKEAAIPREHGELGCMISWQDVRLELVRDKSQMRERLQRDAPARVQHNLSSKPEAFGLQSPPRRAASASPRLDHVQIRSEGWGAVHAADSTLDPYAKMTNKGQTDEQADDSTAVSAVASTRRIANLQVSPNNKLPSAANKSWVWQQPAQTSAQPPAANGQSSPAKSPSPRKFRGDPGFCDSSGEEKRKADRNFSDLFRADPPTKSAPSATPQKRPAKLCGTTWHFLDKEMEIENGSSRRWFTSPQRNVHGLSVEGSVQPESKTLAKRPVDESLVTEAPQTYAFSWDSRAELERLHVQRRLGKLSGPKPTVTSPRRDVSPRQAWQQQANSSQFQGCIEIEAPHPGKPRPVFGTGGSAPSMTRRSYPNLRQLHAHSPETARGRKMAAMLSSECF